MKILNLFQEFFSNPSKISSDPSDLHKIESKYIKYARIFIWLIFLLFFVWLAYRNIIPSGKMQAQCLADDCSRIVSDFASSEQEKIIGETKDKIRYQIISQDKLLFTLKTPKAFKNATVRVELANPDNQPVLNLGALGKKNIFTVTNAYTQIPQLDELNNTWDTICENEICLYARPEKKKQSNLQKNSDTTFDPILHKYGNIEDFLQNLPLRDTIRAYNFDLSTYFTAPNYIPNEKETIISDTLRGGHEIVTYIQNESLYFKFTFQDINRHIGADNIAIILQKEGKTILEKKIQDDGETKATGKPSQPREIEFSPEGLANGIYNIIIRTTDDDVFIRSIISRQHLIQFRDHVYLTDNEEYKELGNINQRPAKLWTNGIHLYARTSHKQNLQTLKIGNKNLQLKNTNDDELLTRTQSDLTQITAPKNDIFISGDGYFVFSQDQLFDPSIFVTPALTNPIPDEVNYVIARYPKPEDLNNGWIGIQSVFTGKQIKRSKNGDYTFSLEAPGLSAANRQLKIRSFSVLLEREPITLLNVWGKLWKKVIALL